MIVKNVHFSNIDKLYEAIAIGKNNTQFNREVGKNMNKLMSHTAVSMIITDVSIFELFIMKMLSNSDNLITLSSSYDIELAGDEYKKTVSDMAQLSDLISNDDDIDFTVGQFFLPSGCVIKDIIVSFTGNSLCSLFGVLPDLFFKNTFEIEKDSEFPSFIPDYEKLENAVVEEFLKNFYKYMNNFVTNIDLVSDSYINANYYNYIDDNRTNVSMSNIFTPYGNLSFFGDNEDIEEQLQNCKVAFSDIPNDIRGLQFKSTELYFVVNSSFYAFLEMFLALPSKFFIDNQDVKTLFMPEHKLLIPDGLDKYTIRLGSKLTNIVTMRNEVSKKTENLLIKYNYVPLNSSFKFGMKISLDEISSTLLKYEKAILEDKIYGDDKNYLTLEIIHILEEIKKNSKTAFLLLQ